MNRIKNRKKKTQTPSNSSNYLPESHESSYASYFTEVYCVYYCVYFDDVMDWLIESAATDRMLHVERVMLVS